MFDIPTLQQLAERNSGNFRTFMRGTDATLWPNNIFVASKVMAGASFENFDFQDFISRQSIKHLSEGIWLERHCLDYGLTRNPPAYAAGTVTLRGGMLVVVPSGLVLQRSNTIEYTTTTGGTTDIAGNLNVSVICNTPGRIGNAPAGSPLVLVAPFAGVDDAVVALATIGGGTDTESDEALRSRLLFRLRNPPMGGAKHDYIIWAREVPGVTRVFIDPVTPDNGRTSVGLWFMMDDVYGDGIPSLADAAAVRTHLATVQPAGAKVDVQPALPQFQDVTISNLTDDSTATRAAILVELQRLFRNDMLLSTITEPQTIWRSKISEAISVAIGEAHHDLVVPATDIAVVTGYIPVLGSVSYA